MRLLKYLKNKKIFPKTWKNHPKKLLIISPNPFFLYWPGCLNGPKTEIQYHHKSPNARLRIYTGLLAVLVLSGSFFPSEEQWGFEFFAIQNSHRGWSTSQKCVQNPLVSSRTFLAARGTFFVRSILSFWWAIRLWVFCYSKLT